MRPIKRIKSHIFYLFFDDRSTARSCGCDQGPHAVLVPENSGLDSYRGLLSCTFPQQEAKVSCRSSQGQECHVLLIFYPLSPRGCTIIHTEGKSVCAHSLDLGICRKCWRMELAGLGWLCHSGKI